VDTPSLFITGIVRAGITVITADVRPNIAEAVRTEIIFCTGIPIVTITERTHVQTPGKHLTGIRGAGIPIVTIDRRAHTARIGARIGFTAGISIVTESHRGYEDTAARRDITRIHGTLIIIVANGRFYVTKSILTGFCGAWVVVAAFPLVIR